MPKYKLHDKVWMLTSAGIQERRVLAVIQADARVALPEPMPVYSGEPIYVTHSDTLRGTAYLSPLATHYVPEAKLYPTKEALLAALADTAVHCG